MSHGLIALGLLAGALFGAATPASKWLLADLTPLQLAGLLYLGAALGVAPGIVRRRSLVFPRDRRSRGLLLGAIAFGGGVGPVLLLLGLRVASAASVALWLNLELAATAVLGALFFRDRLGPSGWLGAALALVAGVVLALGEGAAGLAAGALVAGACLCWGLDNHWTALQGGVPASTTTFWKGAVAGSVNLGLGAATAELAAPPFAVAAALAIGALCYGASIALYVTAAHGLGATRAQLLFASAPCFGVAIAALALGESVTPLQLAAAALLAGSLALVLRDRHAHLHEHAAQAHTHWHRHDDGHHLHAHPAGTRAHTHWHEHAPVSHAHPHWPDLHHRHPHGEET